MGLCVEELWSSYAKVHASEVIHQSPCRIGQRASQKKEQGHTAKVDI
jgi:hypothetical protein